MIIPASPLLQSFEDLGALSEDSGLYEIKPFRDWRSSLWRNKIFKMRLCNVGEILEISTLCSNLPETARIQATKVELIIRSVFSIDSRELLTSEELQKYNEESNNKLTRLEYLRIWAKNLEQIVVDRLDMIYAALQLKQIRMLRGIYLCVSCMNDYTEIPKDSKFLKYSFAEIICCSCLNEIDLKDYDFQETEQRREKDEDKKEATVAERAERSFDFSNYACPCGVELDSFEEFTAHRETCPKSSG